MKNAAIPYLRARLAALFLLSLAAVYGLGMSLAPVSMRRPGQMIWPPVALALATLGGALIMDRLFTIVDRAGRGRLQLIGWLSYGFLLLLVSLGILSGEKGQEAVRTGAGLMRFVQVAFLLLAGLGRGYLGAIVNAFAMTCVAALGGGPAAALAVAAHAGLLVFFLVADHHARLFTDYPVDLVPSPGPVLGRAVLLGLGLGAALALVFWIVPPLPHAPLVARRGAPQSVSPEQAWVLMRDLVAITALAGGAFWLILWLGGGRGRDAEAVPSAKVAARRASESPAPAPFRSARPDPQGWRAKIVHLYIRLGEQLSRLGVRRRGNETPREFCGTLAPESEAAALTDLFSRARYGEPEPTEEEFRAAADAGARILDHFRGR